MSLIITLTGMSTSGKSTLAKALSATDTFREAVSVTTRPMRPGEVNGVDYHFVTDQQFEDYVRDGVLLEHVRSHHAAYGVPAFEVDKILAEGRSPVMVLEPIGVKAIHEVARQRNYNVLSAYVQADMMVIMDRFFSRIDAQRQMGKVINLLQEAKRLHTMLTVEKTWAGVWLWDLSLLNLHKDDNLDRCIISMHDYHSQAKRFSPLDAELKTPCRPLECLGIEDLATLIEKAIATQMPTAEFYREAVAPAVREQSRIKYQDGIHNCLIT